MTLAEGGFPLTLHATADENPAEVISNVDMGIELHEIVRSTAKSDKTKRELIQRFRQVFVSCNGDQKILPENKNCRRAPVVLLYIP